MDIDLDNKKLPSAKVEVDTDYGSIEMKPDGVGVRCVDNCDKTVNDEGILFDQQCKPEDPEDVEVDIITIKNINDSRAADTQDRDPDETEYSSSFANTLSDAEKCSGLSENEVESQFFGDSDLTSQYDAFSSMFQTRYIFVPYCLCVYVCA